MNQCKECIEIVGFYRANVGVHFGQIKFEVSLGYNCIISLIFNIDNCDDFHHIFQLCG